jgi:hypothetical protein
MTHKKYIKYDKSTGKILSTGSCSKSVFDLQVINRPNVAIMEGVIDNENHVIDGIAVYIEPPPPTPEQEAWLKLRDDKRLFSARLIEILLIIENRLRVLEGKPEITKGQLRDWLRSNL